MTGAAPAAAPHPPPSPAWLALAAEDLRALAWLHAEERAPEVLTALYASGFPATLTLVDAARPEAQAMDAALCALASSRCEEADDALPASSVNELAADYAAIYLTHALRASPHESVWLDDDHLMLQGPTFAVRDFYRRHGVQAADWRVRADDHITHELEFVALLLERGETREAARFLKTHLLAWLPDFARRVAQRAATPFYAALAGLTLAACEGCQQRLPTVAVLPQPVLEGTRPGGGCG
ncbi:TorD/DmsD family molecular chaperone [Ottowia testudinis]|uniref:Molecular chaperone TorD family protein n=1 Tax=Ottowia testudinis TaxID=2816950 RepID=A0A975H5M5_9BURK|nr:molecular chaperone TorD family protein [Ottowia testudinis]QTD45107.1 molecular chaperone TorD family protein [Ottowia testudinis]